MKHKVIWCASNNGGSTYFEDKKDADDFASRFGPASGVSVCPVALFLNGPDKQIKTQLDRIEEMLARLAAPVVRIGPR